MLENIGHVLYHVLIILFPILFYYQFLNKGAICLTSKINYRFLITLLVMLLCTMSFPIEVSEGTFYDQKVIPVILAFLYGGWLTGIAVLLSMIYYLYLIGDTHLIIMAVNYFIVGLFLGIFAKKYESFTLKKKIGIITTLFFVITLTRIIRLIYLGNEEAVLLAIIVSIITWISLCTAIMIIENLNMQMKLQYELKRSEKLKVVSELAASVAHEVRNPMTSTRGFLQLMSTDENLNSSQRKYIAISIEELDRAQSIIQDYLSLAKPNKQGIDRINLSVEVEHVIQLMSTYTNIKNTTIVSDVHPDIYIRANRDEMKQVLINLIKNAIEAIEQGGIVKVQVYANERLANIEIIDNGIGMSREQVDRLGTPFYSTKDKGTGIGLTICFQIIELLQGNIEVKSELGKGTTFSIKLPLENSIDPPE